MAVPGLGDRVWERETCGEDGHGMRAGVDLKQPPVRCDVIGLIDDIQSLSRLEQFAQQSDHRGGTRGNLDDIEECSVGVEATYVSDRRSIRIRRCVQIAFWIH